MEQKADSRRKQRDGNWRPIMVRVEPSPDALPIEVAEGLCEHANATQAPVMMSYNGAEIQVWPNEDPQQVAARLEQPSGEKPQHPVIGRQVRVPDYAAQPRQQVRRELRPEHQGIAGTHVIQPGEQLPYEAGKIHTGMEAHEGERGYTMGASSPPAPGITPSQEQLAAQARQEIPASPVETEEQKKARLAKEHMQEIKVPPKP